MKVLLNIDRLSARFRWLTILIWLGLVVATSFLPSLNSVQNNSNTQFLPTGAPSVQAANLADKINSTNLKEATVLLVASSNGAITGYDLDALQGLSEKISKLNTVSQVIPGTISADKKAYLSTIILKVGGLGPSVSGSSAIDKVRALAKKYENNSLQIHITGPLAAAVDSQKAQSHAEDLTGQLSVLVVLILLFLIFRSFLAPILTLLPSLFGLLVSQRLIAESTKLGLQVSELTLVILIVLVIGAGTDYGLFLIFRYREELRKGLGAIDALNEATARVGKSIVFSALTVIVALMTLILSQFGAYKGLGPALAIGIFVTLFANLTLLPALLSIFKLSVFWPFSPKVGQKTQGLWGVFAGTVINKPVAALIAGLVLFGALSALLLDYSPTGFSSTSSSAPNSDSGQGQAILDAHFSKAQFNPTTFVFELKRSAFSDPKTLEVIDKALKSSKLIAEVNGPLNPNNIALTASEFEAIKPYFYAPSQNAPSQAMATEPPLDLAKNVLIARALQNFVSANGRIVAFQTVLSAGDPAGAPAINATPALRALSKEIASKIDAISYGVAGEATGLFDVSAYSNQDLAHIIPVVAAFLFLVLVLLLWAIIAPIYLVLTVSLSYLASLGFALLVFKIILHQGGINFVLPFLMFIFLMALGEDYNILVISRIKEEAAKRSLKEAIKVAIGTTGTTITSAGLILASTFALLTANGPGQVQQIGLGLAFGIIIDTFFVRSVLVPSIAVLLKDWNWWPSKFGKSSPSVLPTREAALTQKTS